MERHESVGESGGTCATLVENVATLLKKLHLWAVMDGVVHARSLCSVDVIFVIWVFSLCKEVLVCDGYVAETVEPYRAIC